MATFIGFSTIGKNKSFTTVDNELVKIDLLNAFNIRQGELPGRPNYGTVLWSFLFENQIAETQTLITNEVHRVASGDPRIFIQDLVMYPQNNGVLIELSLQIVSGIDPLMLSIFFDQTSGTASYV